MKTEELCVHPAEMKLLAFWVCSLLTAGRNPFENLRSSLRACKLSFFLHLYVWVSDISRPTSQQTIRKRMPHQGHRQVISWPTVGALWGQNSAGAKRTGCEPTANMRGFESLVSKTHQKRLLCICCLHRPTSTFPVSVNPVQPVPRTYSLKFLWSRFQTDLLSPDLVVTCLSTCLSTNQGLSSQWTTPSCHLPVPPAFPDNCLNLSIDFSASRPLVLPSLGVSPYYLPEIFLPAFWLLIVSAPAAAESLSCV